MMKLVSFAAIAGVASAARERTPPATSTTTRRQHQSDGPTKEKLESSTRQFVQDNLRQKSRTTAKAPVDVGHYAPRKRALRSVSDREGRHGKAGKHEEGGGEDDDEDDDHGHMHGHGHGHGDDEYGHDDDEHGHGHDDDHHNHYDDDDSHGHGSDSKSGKRGKSGKSPKGGKSRDDEHEHEHEELFYLLPTACPNECITSMVTGSTYEFTDSIRQCKANDESHMWLVRSDGSYITIESYYEPGMCIAVDYQRGDAEAMLAKTCYNGELVLKECDSDYGTEWYFTGGQLINSMCWGAGLSSLMTVFFEDDDNGNGDELVVKECKKDVAVWGANDEAVLKADTFMFVNRLPETPFVIDDVQAALDMAGNNANDVEGAE